MDNTPQTRRSPSPPSPDRALRQGGNALSGRTFPFRTREQAAEHSMQELIFLDNYYRQIKQSILQAERDYAMSLLHPYLWSKIEFEFTAAERAMGYSEAQDDILTSLANRLNDELSASSAQVGRVQQILSSIDVKRAENNRLRDEFRHSVELLTPLACKRRNTYQDSLTVIVGIERKVAEFCRTAVTLDLWIMKQVDTLACPLAIIIMREDGKGRLLEEKLNCILRYAIANRSGYELRLQMCPLQGQLIKHLEELLRLFQYTYPDKLEAQGFLRQAVRNHNLLMRVIADPRSYGPRGLLS